MTSKNVVADLIKGEKVDGTNSDLWNKKIQYIFNEQEVLETFTTAMEPPEEENTTQHRRNKQVYDVWFKKDLCTHFIMFIGMHNDLIGQFENCRIA